MSRGSGPRADCVPQSLKASLTFSPACLTLAFVWSALPSASRSRLFVAWPTFSLAAPPISSPLLRSLSSLPITSPLVEPDVAPARAARRDRGSVVAQRRDQLGLAHGGPSLDADLAGTLQELVLRPVLVVTVRATLAAHRGTRAVRRRVRDAGRLLLAGSVVAQGLVHLLVLDAGAGVLARHVPPAFPLVQVSRTCSVPDRAAPKRPRMLRRRAGTGQDSAAPDR